VVAVSLISANWFTFVTGVVVLFLLIVRTRTEERHLVARFGDTYRAYVEGTGDYSPRSVNDLRVDLHVASCHLVSGGSSVIQTVLVCSPRLNTILSRATAISGA
jgi:hypothetical protein